MNDESFNCALSMTGPRHASRPNWVSARCRYPDFSSPSPESSAPHYSTKQSTQIPIPWGDEAEALLGVEPLDCAFGPSAIDPKVVESEGPGCSFPASGSVRGDGGLQVPGGGLHRGTSSTLRRSALR